MSINRPDILKESPLLAKLESIARQTACGELSVLYCKDEKVLRLNLKGEEATLPDFCQLVRSTPEGEKRCSACRSLVALRACSQGLTDYSCHGGISVLAAPAIAAKNGNSEFVVVSSCAFSESSPKKGWEAAREHAKGLPIDVEQLKAAYLKLPILTEEKERLAKSLVETAACAIAEMDQYNQHINQQEIDAFIGLEIDEEENLEEILFNALTHAREHFKEEIGPKSGSALTDIVKLIVSRNPALPFSVINIARAARITPNHFSMIFRKHHGNTFSDFLTGQRLAVAKELLRDVTMSISEVAKRTGFTDSNYFSRKFKQELKMTPREFRRQ